ncbi:RHS repeat domain-containing protein [Bacteroidota bacterium]
MLTYSYNNSGALDSMSAVKSQQSFNYVDNISYDKFGSRAKINYGNGTRAHYTYDSQTRRLSNLKSYDSQDTLMQNIDYDYDDVGNISDIENFATAVNGLGGVYDYNYEYDSLYRLISSAGSFTDGHQTNYPFSLDMTYSASGNISSKELTATTLLNGAITNIDYSRDYNYNQTQPHAIENINDPNSGIDLDMQWDANGNMTQFFNSATGETRRMCWDEENRLAVVKDPSYASHYVYNAGGERVWKITGPIERMTVNGKIYFDQTMLDYKTLYSSPYMVVSDMEYTKHFYAESQRVTTKLGGGFSPSLVDPHGATLDPIEGSIQEIAENLWTYIYQNTECVDGEPEYISIEPNLPIVEELLGSDDNEGDLYFYHPDHLGSSSFITDVNGDVNQHLQYLPFGESFIDQQTNHNIRFTFSSKEKDSETGFGYFGARYYSSDLSIWLSVDPMADRYPSMSSFMYCAGNPINIIDPNGLSISIFDENGKYVETKKDNFFHNLFIGRKGQIVSKDGDVKSTFKFDDYKNDKDKLIKGEQVLDLEFEKKVDDMIEIGSSSINEYIEQKKENNENFPVFKGVETAVTSGEANFMDGELRDNNKLILIDGVGYNNYDAGNFLTGAAVKKSNTIGQFIFRIGAHVNNHRYGNQQNVHNDNMNYEPQKGLIRLDARADQKAIRNGFRYQRKKR